MVTSISNIIVSGGTNPDKIYLSCTADGKEVDLWSTDDDSGRQKWTFVKLNDNVYNILVFGGTPKDRTYLSCTADGKVDLWSTDDGSGRQKWVVEPISPGVYNIKVKGGTNQGETYLSCRADGFVDLYSMDDGSGRQKWKINAGILNPIVGLEFLLNQGKILGSKLIVVGVQTITNLEPTEQSTAMTFSKEITTSSHFEESNSATMESNVEVITGVPELMEGKISTKLSATKTFSDGYSTSTKTKVEGEFALKLPPQAISKCTLSVTQCDLEVPCIFKLKDGGRRTGVWKGVVVSTGDLSSKVENIEETYVEDECQFCRWYGITFLR